MAAAATLGCGAGQQSFLQKFPRPPREIRRGLRSEGGSEDDSQCKERAKGVCLGRNSPESDKTLSPPLINTATERGGTTQCFSGSLRGGLLRTHPPWKDVKQEEEMLVTKGPSRLATKRHHHLCWGDYPVWNTLGRQQQSCGRTSWRPLMSCKGPKWDGECSHSSTSQLHRTWSTLGIWKWEGT